MSSFDDNLGAARAQVDALLNVLEHTADAGERAELLVEIAAKIKEGLRDEDQALDALLQAWRVDPTCPTILDALEPLARSQNRWAEIFEVTRELVVAEQVPARSLAYAEAMVRWLTREVPTPDVALHYLERVRHFDSTHWLVHLFQAAKYGERGDTKREIECLDRAVLSAKRADDRARIHLMMAARYAEDRTKNSALAKKHLLAANALTPDSMEALRGLEKVHAAEGDVPSLVEVLEKQVESSKDDPERVRILLRLADTYEKQLLKPDLAVTKLEMAFALDPDGKEALLALERCYTAMRSWEDLVRVLEAAVVLVEDPQERAERLIALAEIFESRLKDLGGAVQAYERLDRLLPEDETLVGELARLTEKMGDWEAAVKYRVKLAALTPDAATRARMHAQAGQLLLPHDRVAAREQFERAVTFDPQNAPAWNALLGEARASGNPERVAELLEERADATEAPRARSQIYAELGGVRFDLGDDERAVAAWEAALAADPNNEEAARALLDRYVAAGRYEEAAPVCDVVMYASERDADLDRLFVARLQACLIALQLDRSERALDLVMGAYDLRPTSTEARRALVQCAWTLRAAPNVLDATEPLAAIADDPEGLTVEERAQLGEVLALSGERDRAVHVFEGVLADQPENPAALAGLSALKAARGESIAAWTLKRQLAETTADSDERYFKLVEAGDGFVMKANRPDLAAEVYEEARGLRPTDRTLLHKLLAQYQALEDWSRVFDVLRAIADADPDASRKARVVTTMAQIAQEKLADPTKAVGLYDEALDLDVTRLDAFESLVRLLTAERDWSGLRYMYKRMITRASRRGDARLEHALHHQLGLVYRDRLGDRESAIASFRAAVQLAPGAEEDQAILRELLSMSGRVDHAVALTLERVRKDPLERGPYPALFDLLAQGRYVDRAWCVASVMAHLGVVHPPASAFFAANPPPAVDQIAGTLGDEGWRRLLHHELDPTLTVIFEIMAAAAVESRVAQLGLRERFSYPGPAFTQPVFVAADVKAACSALGVAEPRIYAAKAPPVIGVGATRPPSLLVRAESLPGFPRAQLSFWIGKRLAEIAPPLLARGLFRSVSELKDLVTAAARPQDPLRQHVRREKQRELAAAVESAMAAGGALDVKRWSQLADLSSTRVGVVLAGDVETARLALMREAQSPGDLGPREQVREIVAFFLSEEYAQIRAALRVSLG